VNSDRLWKIGRGANVVFRGWQLPGAAGEWPAPRCAIPFRNKKVAIHGISQPFLC